MEECMFVNNLNITLDLVKIVTETPVSKKLVFRSSFRFKEYYSNKNNQI
jgi:hypothetical protein